MRRMDADYLSDKVWEDWLLYKQRGTFVAVSYMWFNCIAHPVHKIH